MSVRKASCKVQLRNQFPRILVLCEGKCTEPQYLHAVRCSLRIPEQNLQILCPPAVPNTPREMIAYARQKKRDKQDSFDQIWCVFDIEYGADQAARFGISEAYDNAKRNAIKTAISNPCFEIWLLIHIEPISAAISRHQACKKCKELRIVAEKDICDPQRLIELYHIAKQHAEKLMDKHKREGKKAPEEMIPSSGMHLLIDEIYAAFPRRSRGQRLQS